MSTSETDLSRPQQLSFPLISGCIPITSSTGRLKRWNPIWLFLHFHYLKWKLEQLFHRRFVQIFFLMLARIFGMRSHSCFRAGCIKAKASIYFGFVLLTRNTLTFWGSWTLFLRLWLHLRSEQQLRIWTRQKTCYFSPSILTFRPYSHTIKITKCAQSFWVQRSRFPSLH